MRASNNSMIWGASLLLVTVQSLAAEEFPLPIDTLAAWVEGQCLHKETGSPEVPVEWRTRETRVEPISRRGANLGQRVLVLFDGGETLRLDHIGGEGRPERWVMETRSPDDRPLVFIGVDGQCELREVRRLVYQDGAVMQMERLDQSFRLIGHQMMNPPVPPLSPESKETPRSRIGLVDSGVNYLLPEIFIGLAADETGRLLGYDFWDMDHLPFDAHPAASPFFVQRHGTRTASLLLAEAPEASIVPYRYPRSDMNRMKDLVAHAAALDLRIIAMPLGSNNPEDWAAFEFAARMQPQILFIASAGNNGRNIDEKGVFPAALDLPNLLVVSSANDSLRPARGSNTGPMAVDYLVPAEELEVTDFDGENRRVSGSSYAVSRLAALASRLLASQPELDIQGLKQAIRGLSITELGEPSVRIGVIPDPRADIAQVDWLDSSDRFPAYPDSLPRRPDGHTEVTMHSVRLDLRILDDRWQSEEIMPAIAAAETILGQCGIVLSVKAVHRFSGTEYLRDFSIGSSYSLLNRIQSAKDPTIRLFFARDSRMQMQFEAEAFAPGNTRTRPWLRNSVWVMHGAPDLPETLAHELFHVLANDGGHVSGTGNLMAERTSPGRNRLTPAQCGLARQYFSRH